MLVLGGQAQCTLLCDAHLLLLKSRRWLAAPRLPCSGVCRHGAAALDCGIAVWGGWDGERCVGNFFLLPWLDLWSSCSLQHVGVPGPKERRRLSSAPEPTAAIGAEAPAATLLQPEAWDKEAPLSLKDVEAAAAKGQEKELRALENLRRVAPERRPQATWVMLHRLANAAGKEQYVDPASGYTVFTAKYLKKRPCCGNRCRHCPHGHINVPESPLAAVVDDW